MEAKLRALAAGQMPEDLAIIYSDMHGLYGGVTITIRAGGHYERIKRQQRAGAPAVARGTLTSEQVADVGRRLEVTGWEQRTPERTPVPDESFATLTVRCDGSQATVWEWYNERGSERRMERVRDFMAELGDKFASASPLPNGGERGQG
ncbi:MAG: hypothetical protein M3347_13745 [Armatimonadota bacterium]|nr:hypothetical protein [Armatimonadota bacterium]